MVARKRFPKGKPERARKRLASLWEWELKKAGIPGTVSVEHSPYEDIGTKERGLARKLWDALDDTDLKHVYFAKLPGAPWPLRSEVSTTKKGVIIYILLQTRFPKRLAGELEFVKEPSLFWQTSRFVGEGEDALNANKQLVKTLEKSLSRVYQSLFTTYRIETAAIRLTPVEDGTEVTLITTVHAFPLGFGKTLGLGKCISALKALEAAL